MGSNPIALPKEINNLRYFSLVIIEPDFSQGNTWDNAAPLSLSASGRRAVRLHPSPPPPPLYLWKIMRSLQPDPPCCVNVTPAIQMPDEMLSMF
jgi:hypothetical protein